MADQSTTVAGIHLSTCVYNASGPRSGTAAALAKVAQSAAGAVLTKSATMLSQTGNPHPRTHHSPDNLASFNSEGLPNNGIDYYLSKETIDEALEGTDKPYIVSLSGKSLEDNIAMLMRVAGAETRNRIAAVELNLACPNVIGKPIIAYDMEQLEHILSQVSMVEGLPPLGVKLPPYLDFSHFSQAASVLNRFKTTVKYVATINTIGNALAIDTASESPYIASNNGFAGLSGPAVKYTALANVKKLRALLDNDIDVVGVGGVCTGNDVFQMILCGAAAVQVGTTHWKEGPACFDRIVDELGQLMLSKGYTSLSDFRGKLRPWSKEGAARARATTATSGGTKADSARDSSKKVASSSELQFYKVLVALLVVVIAILMSSDHFQVKLLPPE